MIGMCILEFALSSVGFLEISRNCLTTLKARQVAHASKTISGVFCYALPGG